MCKLRVYYSGEDNKANPETVLKDEGNVMYTFHNVHRDKGKLPIRYKRMFLHRKLHFDKRGKK